MLIVIKGIHKVKRPQADGSVKIHYYAWRGGPRMKSKPHTEAFAREYRELQGRPAKVDTIDTLETLIDRFTGPEHNRNPDFTALAQSTQEDHLYSFKLIRKQWPQLPVKLTQQKGMKADIKRWHRAFAENPRKADKLLMSLSKVFSYAVDDELIEKNPCTGIDKLYHGSRREILWSADQIAAFRAGAHPHLLLPFELAINTGQRQGDILAFNWKNYDGIYVMVRQSKSQKNGVGGKKLKVKANARLKPMLDDLPKDTLRICLNSRGRPWTRTGFQASWGKELDRLEDRGGHIS